MRVSPKRKRYLALQRERGGRTPKWQDGQTLTRLLRALVDPTYLTKAAVARAAGIGYATLARWQAEHPELDDLWQSARHGRYRLRQAARSSRAAARTLLPRRPAPTKQMRLVCWFLVFRVHPEHSLGLAHEHRACERVRLSWERWQAVKDQFPSLIESVYTKRARRLSHLIKHGSIDINWCPPDPARRFPPPYPSFALHHWKRGSTFDGVVTHERAQSPRTGQRWL